VAASVNKPSLLRCMLALSLSSKRPSLDFDRDDFRSQLVPIARPEVARHYGIPCRARGGYADASVPDVCYRRMRSRSRPLRTRVAVEFGRMFKSLNFLHHFAPTRMLQNFVTQCQSRVCGIGSDWPANCNYSKCNLRFEVSPVNHRCPQGGPCYDRLHPIYVATKYRLLHLRNTPPTRNQQDR
jgi:hypothetical protein